MICKYSIFKYYYEYNYHKVEVIKCFQNKKRKY